MISFFFGHSHKKLYGVYHPSPMDHNPSRAALLCYPLGQELIRSHWAFRQLATMLAQQGIPTLRFDYFATGDSCGETQEASLAEWYDDISMAIRELKDCSQVNRIIMIGLRFGATLGGLQASRFPEIDQIILWDPIGNGKNYLIEMMRLQNQLLHKGLLGKAFPRWSWPGSNSDELLGFSFPINLRKSLDSLNFDNYSPLPHQETVFVFSQGNERDFQWPHSTHHQPQRLTTLTVNEPCGWNDLNEFQHKILPNQVLQKIVECAGGKR